MNTGPDKEQTAFPTLPYTYREGMLKDTLKLKLGNSKGARSSSSEYVHGRLVKLRGMSKDVLITADHSSQE